MYEINNPTDKTYEIYSNEVELTKIKSYLNRLIYDVYPNELKSVLEISLTQTSSENDFSSIKIGLEGFKKRKIFPSSNPYPDRDTKDKCSRKIICAIVLPIVCVVYTP